MTQPHRYIEVGEPAFFYIIAIDRLGNNIAESGDSAAFSVSVTGSISELELQNFRVHSIERDQSVLTSDHLLLCTKKRIRSQSQWTVTHSIKDHLPTMPPCSSRMRQITSRSPVHQFLVSSARV